MAFHFDAAATLQDVQAARVKLPERLEETTEDVSSLESQSHQIDTLVGIILPTIKLKVYTFAGLLNSATKNPKPL